MKSKHNERESRELDGLISDLCDIILVKEDSLNLDTAKQYVIELTDYERGILEKTSDEDKILIRSIVLEAVTKYIQQYQAIGTDKAAFSLFAYVGNTDYISYQADFVNTYNEFYSEQEKDVFPFSLAFALECIWEISEHYFIFQKFYDVRVTEIHDKILIETEQKTKETVNNLSEKFINNIKSEAEKIVKEAVSQAENKALEAAESANKATNQAENASDKAKSAVEIAVNNKMSEITAHISETSVTILGVFAGIVLTIVAGLFYSSAVLESVSSANVHKLFLIASIVGFVCVNIIAVMFDYIIKIKEKKEDSDDKDDKKRGNFKEFRKNVKRHLFIIIIDTILLFIMLIAACTYKDTTNNEADITNQENCVDSSVGITLTEQATIIVPLPTNSPNNVSTVDSLEVE